MAGGSVGNLFILKFVQDVSIEKLCEYQSDMAVKLESFAGSAYETNPAFKEYHGLLRIHKLGPVNTLVTHVPESLDLAFKLRRKKFVIEVRIVLGMLVRICRICTLQLTFTFCFYII